MDSSDLRLIIGLLFGMFLAIVLLSDLAKRKSRAPKIKVKKVKQTGFRRIATPETPANGGFRSTPAAPEGPRSPRHDWKVPRG
jgi:hypothetical protein